MAKKKQQRNEPRTNIERFFGQRIPNAKEFSESDPTRREAEMTGEFITQMVDLLRRGPFCPNREIHELMGLFWDLVGNQLVPTAVTSFVSEPGLMVVSSSLRFEPGSGIIAIPFGWGYRAVRQPLQETCALVFCASQSRDYFNNRLAEGERVVMRANAYEAEFLNAMNRERKYEEKDLTPLLQQILVKFPQGLRSLPQGVHYRSQPFSPPGSQVQ